MKPSERIQEIANRYAMCEGIRGHVELWHVLQYLDEEWENKNKPTCTCPQFTTMVMKGCPVHPKEFK